MITSSEFEKYFRTYFDQLFKLANSLLCDVEESRDVVHEVFAQLWEKKPKIEQGKIKDYLMRATYNRCLNQIKRKGNFNVLKEPYLNELRFNMNPESFDWEKWLQIQAFIKNEMPPRTRQAIDLCFGEEKSYKEAAIIMGVGTGAINRHIVTGLRLLRDKFKNKKN